MSDHMPTPWEIDPTSMKATIRVVKPSLEHGGRWRVATVGTSHVPKTKDCQMATAKHIVHCVNTHDALVEVLEDLSEEVRQEHVSILSVLFNKYIDRAKAALDAEKEKYDRKH